MFDQVLLLKDQISRGFWNEYVWLPPNTTWADIAPGSREDVNHTNHIHLGYPIIMALFMLGIRTICEKYWFAPIGLALGIKNQKVKKAKPNEILENAYKNDKNPNHKKLVMLCKQIDWSERQVERWLRLRRKQDRPSTLTKFCENHWRFVYYFTALAYGLYVLWDKSWLWDINYCWYNFPHQGVENGIWWYYMISLSFYWSLFISQFTDVKRKDFWQMFIHHIITISLISFSWICNMHRIGSLVLLVHDCADTLLELAKMLKYMGWQKICDIVFAMFATIWIVTRLGIFPFWIIRSTSIEAPKILPMFPAYYIFNTLLILLLTLHCIWTWFILKIAYKAMITGHMEGDIRSSTSDSSSTEYSDVDNNVSSNHVKPKKLSNLVNASQSSPNKKSSNNSIQKNAGDKINN